MIFLWHLLFIRGKQILLESSDINIRKKYGTDTYNYIKDDLKIPQFNKYLLFLYKINLLIFLN